MKASRLSSLLAALLGILIGLSCPAQAPDDVLAETSKVKLTRADYEAALVKIPPELREEFATSSRRLTLFLNNVLVRKTLALQARQAGLQPDIDVTDATPEDIETSLAAVQVRAIENAAGADFDSRHDSMILAARENYKFGKDKYKRGEQIKISAILISFTGRGEEAALALAKSTRDKLLSGFEFAALAKQVSDEKVSGAEGGSLPWSTAEHMHPALAKPAFAMSRIGDISEPVAYDNSYVLIRLEGRRPPEYMSFEEVQDKIMETMRADYVKRQRESKLDAIRGDPTMKVNQPAIDALLRRVDTERFKPPVDKSAPAGAQSPK